MNAIFVKRCWGREIDNEQMNLPLKKLARFVNQRLMRSPAGFIAGTNHVNDGDESITVLVTN